VRAARAKLHFGGRQNPGAIAESPNSPCLRPDVFPARGPPKDLAPSLTDASDDDRPHRFHRYSGDITSGALEGPHPFYDDAHRAPEQGATLRPNAAPPTMWSPTGNLAT
jgi:hypothetical protein